MTTFPLITAHSTPLHLFTGQILLAVLGILFICLGILRECKPGVMLPLGLGLVIANLGGSSPLTHGAANSLVSGWISVFFFLCLGASADFGRLLRRPELLVVALAVPLTMLASFALALLLPFNIPQAFAQSSALSGEGALAVFTAGWMAPALTPAVGLSALLLCALTPVFLPALLKSCVPCAERNQSLPVVEEVEEPESWVFALGLLVILGVFARGSFALGGALCAGSLLRESAATRPLAAWLRGTGSDLAWAALSFAVGLSGAAGFLYHPATLAVLLFAAAGAAAAVLIGVGLIRLLNRFRDVPLNPLLGGAVLCALPESAQTVHETAQDSDPSVFLLDDALACSLASLIAVLLMVG